MTERQARPRPVPIPRESVSALIETATRAPSILNTQPWLFRVTPFAIDLYPDPSRKLRSDLSGREMLVSCGAALFGLRLAIRALGYQPDVRLLPTPEQPSLLARVRLGATASMTDSERRLMDALPHRHTGRGGYAPGPLPKGLFVGLQHDAVAEDASLALVDRPADYSRLSAIVARSASTLSADNQAISDIRRWVRLPGSTARDGVPASSVSAPSRGRPGRLVQRNLTLERGTEGLDPVGAPPAATAILLTAADTRADWLRAGQALHRVLAHAASRWVFAELYSQPLESAPTRAMIRAALRLPGAPQLLLQFGLARTARPTARRPTADVLLRARPG
jgi:hypothetical protein